MANLISQVTPFGQSNDYGLRASAIQYGTCSTAAGTVEKAVTCASFTSNYLTEGSIIAVKFSNTNTGAVGSLKLNVNSTGAKSIKYIYNGTLSNLPNANYLRQDQIYLFYYDGTNWVVLLNYNTNDVSALTVTNNEPLLKWNTTSKIGSVKDIDLSVKMPSPNPEFIVGTWASASGTWTGVSKDTELFDGKEILLYMPFNGSGNATLNLTLATDPATTTGAKNVYYENTTRFSTQKGQNSIIHLVYKTGLKLSNGTTYEGWWYATPPSTHSHGNITNDGKIGSTANYSVVTTTNGSLTATSLTTTDPAVEGNTTEFISNITQDSKGQITALKKAVTPASTSAAGIVKLSDSTSSTSTSLAATANAVKSAYDKANAAIPKSIGTAAGDIIYWSASGTPTRLAAGTGGQVLKITNGVPTWGEDGDTHHVAHLITAASNTAKDTAAGGTNSVYLNLIEDSGVRDSHQIVGSGLTTVASNASGKITITSTHPAYTAADAAAVKVGRDATGHVVMGAELGPSDVGAAPAGHEHNVSLASDTGTSTVTLTSGGKFKLSVGNKNVIFTMPTSNNYSHPTFTAASAAAIKVGRDSEGHVVLGDPLSLTDIGAAPLEHTHTTSLVTDTGTENIELAHGGKYKLTTGGTSVIFKLPAQYSHPTGTAKDPGVYKVGSDALGHVRIGAAIGLSDLGAAAEGHTHSISLAADSNGTNPVALAHGSQYKLTAGGQSVIFTMPAGYVHPNGAQGETTPGIYKVGSDATGHVKIGAQIGLADLGAAPAEHAHGNLTSDGKIGSNTSANKAVYTTTNGALTTGTLPVAAGGTGQTSVANIKAGKDADGNTISSTYLKLSGGTMTGKITLDGDPTSEMHAATKQYVDNAFIANDAMVFKGTLGASAQNPTVTALPNAHYTGWTYRVVTAGTYAGLTCEVGDLVICITDGTSANNAHWVAAQSNVDAPLYKDGNTLTSGNPLVADGTGGKAKTVTVSDLINLLGEGTSPAQRGDYIVAQYAGGGTSTTSYHRRKLSNIFAALNTEDIVNALGFTPAETGHTHPLSIASGGTATVTLSANTAYTLTAGGKTLVFKTPADGNTDTKVNVVARGANKAYLMGDITAPTATAAAHTAVAETGIYMTTTTGELNATQYKIYEKAYIHYDTTDDVIAFTFI